MFSTARLTPKYLHWYPAGIIPDGSGVPTGTPLSDPPLVEMISEDPVLRNTKLIAEAWDCDGLFQVPSCHLTHAAVLHTQLSGPCSGLIFNGMGRMNNIVQFF